MPRYVVKSSTFSIGSSVYQKGNELTLPDVAGRFGVGRGDLEEVTENGTYETRVMKPKTRTRRRTAHKIVIPGKEESEPTVEQEPDNTGDSE